VRGYNTVRGLPFKSVELAEAITDLIAHTVSTGPATAAGSPQDPALGHTGEMEALT
jgi:hypothetical protein